MEQKKTSQNKNQEVRISGHSKRGMSWPIKVLILTFSFSVGLSILSETISSRASVILSLLIIVVFFIINVFFDIVGVATTVCEKNQLETLFKEETVAKKIALKMVENNEKVCSFCCDIIGDICGILSGSAGASLIFKFHINLSGAQIILISTLISSLIASLTVFAKAVGKKVAIKNSSKIVFRISKFAGLFIKIKKTKKV